MIRNAFLAPAALLMLLAGHLTAAAQVGRLDDITQAQKDAITAQFAGSFIHPELVLWRYEFTRPYPLGGYSICGEVNYVSSTRQYVGWQKFFARFQDGKIVEAGFVPIHLTNPAEAVGEAYNVTCGGTAEPRP